jgi:hypothetical protein
MMFIFPLFFLATGIRYLSRFFRRYYTDDDEQLDWDGARAPFRGESDSQPFEVVKSGPSQDAQVFSLAYRLGGKLTVSDVIIETGLEPQRAEHLLNGLVDEVRVRMIVDERGFVVYEFPEIIDRLERES